MRARRAPLPAVALLCAVAALPLAAGAAKKPTCFGKAATIVGTAHADFLKGTARNDVIVSLAGADRIESGSGRDLVCAGAGADVLDGQAGVDSLDGGAGFDICRTGERLVGCEETRPAPPKGPLAPGQYFTDLFVPRFALTIRAPGWTNRYGDRVGEVQLFRREDPGGLYLAFFATSQTPATAIGILGSRHGLTAGPSVPASFGGATGQRIDVENTSDDFVGIPYGTDNALEATDKARFYAVATGGKTVVVQVEAPDDEFASWLEEAGKVLDSVKFAS